ncbi:MAG: cytochrome c [Desulfuromonadaceae bacterium]|nr:cytochrome c [Desulfuromonadaceae bacterium]
MNLKTLNICVVALLTGLAVNTTAQAKEPPNMPYVFEKNCFLCHKSPERTGPINIYDMLSRTGNPLHEQYIRSNVRFGLRAMPAFRVSEVSPKGLNAIIDYLKDVAAYRKINREYKPVPAE